MNISLPEKKITDRFIEHNKSDNEISEPELSPIAKKLHGVYLPLPEQQRNHMELENSKRRQLAAEICAKRNTTLNKTLEHIMKIKRYTNLIVDDENKIMYCYVPKVGCTSWKVKLALMTSKGNKNILVNTHPTVVDDRGGLFPFGLRMLSSYTPREILLRLKTHFKFIFVRHPTERILSTFRSKGEKRVDNRGEYPWFYNTWGMYALFNKMKGRGSARL